MLCGCHHVRRKSTHTKLRDARECFKHPASVAWTALSEVKGAAFYSLSPTTTCHGRRYIHRSVRQRRWAPTHFSNT